ncbi:MAG: hypothetical protein HOP30_09255 [Cyclobacteriaceae bacterium]|nr:hypothetical protein [Cyclobacteriaceae bacterium]
MKKQNDSGYPVNVASQVKLIEIIATFGAAYNPVKSSIKLENLKALLDRVKLSLKEVDTSIDVLSKASKMREHVFDELGEYVTCIVGAVGSCDILPARVESFASLVRKFRAQRATPSNIRDSPDAPAAEETKTNSTAVSKAEAEFSSALIARDKLFYAPPDGLVPCGKAVKSYVKSAFKASSPEFKLVSGIPFTNEKKK